MIGENTTRRLIDTYLDATVSSRATSVALSSAVTTIMGVDARNITEIYDRQATIEITPEQIWKYATALMTTTGSVGKVITDDLSTLKTRVPAVLPTFPSDPASQSLITLALATVQTEIKGASDRDITQIYDRQTTTEITPKQIWDYATSSLTVTGSIGKKIYDDFNTLLASTGGNNFTILVKDTGNTPIVGVTVALWNSAYTALIEVSKSNASGLCYFSVADGTYKAYATKYGSYTFSGNPTTIVVASGSPTPTYLTGTAISSSSDTEETPW